MNRGDERKKKKILKLWNVVEEWKIGAKVFLYDTLSKIKNKKKSEILSESLLFITEEFVRNTLYWVFFRWKKDLIRNKKINTEELKEKLLLFSSFLSLISYTVLLTEEEGIEVYAYINIINYLVFSLWNILDKKEERSYGKHNTHRTRRKDQNGKIIGEHVWYKDGKDQTILIGKINYL